MANFMRVLVLIVLALANFAVAWIIFYSLAGFVIRSMPEARNVVILVVTLMSILVTWLMVREIER
jgi:hypothetical protein